VVCSGKISKKHAYTVTAVRQIQSQVFRTSIQTRIEIKQAKYLSMGNVNIMQYNNCLPQNEHRQKR
jgi:hypothetical protein